jgi:hypothetical protein
MNRKTKIFVPSRYANSKDATDPGTLSSSTKLAAKPLRTSEQNSIKHTNKPTKPTLKPVERNKENVPDLKKEQDPVVLEARRMQTIVFGAMYKTNFERLDKLHRKTIAAQWQEWADLVRKLQEHNELLSRRNRLKMQCEIWRERKQILDDARPRMQLFMSVYSNLVNKLKESSNRLVCKNLVFSSKGSWC